MTLQEAANALESLKTETTKKYEIKVYEKFLHILAEMKIRQFSSDEIQALETELEHLDLKSNPENRKKHFKKALSKFETYLRETFLLIPKAYYQKLYGSLGLSFGLLFGVAILSNLERSLAISLGLLGGMVVGLILGCSKDSKAKTEGRVY